MITVPRDYYPIRVKLSYKNYYQLTNPSMIYAGDDLSVYTSLRMVAPDALSIWKEEFVDYEELYES